ncbi:MAG: phosphotransferase [Desulfobacterales bacterium]|nr:phosphotransferase [Desulfobacterales bacterium]
MNPNFHSLLSGIPDTRWEQALPIGKFVRLEIGDVVKRPFSFISKCRVIGNDDCKTVFIKYYRNTQNISNEELCKKIEKDYKIAVQWNKFFAESDKFHVVRPAMTVPDKFIMVTREVEGENLFDVIAENALYFRRQNKSEQIIKYFHNVGQWLRYKHNKLADKNERYSVDDLIEYIDVRLKILTEDKTRRFPLVYRKKVLDFIKKHSADLSDGELLATVCHNDFNPGNIIVDTENVTVLDFGRSVKDCYLLDASKLYYQLNLFTFKPYYRPYIIRQLQDALLDGFENIQVKKLMMFRFMLIRNTLTHLANITRFRQNSYKEKLYNLWVLRKELHVLDLLLKEGVPK